MNCRFLSNLIFICGLAYFLARLYLSIGEAPNLLTNGSFEEKSIDKNKSLYGWRMADGRWHLDSDVYKEGRKSIRNSDNISFKGDTVEISSDRVRVDPFKPHCLDYSVKIKEIDDKPEINKGIFVFLFFFDKNGDIVKDGYLRTQPVHGERDWQNINFNFTPPRRSYHLAINPRIFKNTGVVWLDGVRVYRTNWLRKLYKSSEPINFYISLFISTTLITTLYFLRPIKEKIQIEE